MNEFREVAQTLRFISRSSSVKFAVYIGLVAALYYSILPWLILHDWMREDYSHCMLIPAVFLYLIWDKRQALMTIPSSPSWYALAALIPGFALYWLGELGGELYTIYISLWLTIVGLTWLHLGWIKMKAIGFALLILLTMFPPPNLINVKLTSGLKLISSHLGVWILHLYGMSAYREGNVIDLGFTQLQVVDACSGLRYLFPLLVMGILLAYFYRAVMWKKLVLVISTIPLTILVNSLRIAFTGIIYAHWGAAAAEGFFHGFSGWLIFIISIFILIAEMKVLCFRQKTFGENGWFGILQTSVSQSRKLNVEPCTPTSMPRNSHLGLRTFLSPSHFIVVTIFLAINLIISMGIEFREKIPTVKPVSQMPISVGNWTGSRQFMGQEILKDLDLTDYTIIDFKNEKNQFVNFYVAYYASQKKGESIHSPESCLPASGWSFNHAGKAQVALDGGRRVATVNRAIMEKGGYRQLSYFWFPMRGRVLTNAWEMKIYTFWDALTRQRTDGALVRLITPVLPGEQIEDAEKRLQEFTKQIVPVLDQFLPK